ncbi:MAG TPA: peptidoglycan-binding domain-containing protein [Candidatus Eisenbacteria bacterium]|nr:peptidoglycan-binding domain-containing protein [Candidatus Eisenbacteria bacterium]
MKQLLLTLGAVALATAVGCAPLSRQPTQREQTAAIGGLAGGAGGAIIGSFIGSAVTGGLFGMPLGAVVGYYVGDQMANEDRMREARMDEREAELARLRRENERLRSAADQPPRTAQLSGENRDASPAQGSVSEQNITRSREGTEGKQQPPTSGQPGPAKSQQAQQQLAGSEQVRVKPSQVRQAQKKLNDMGFHAGHADGVMGPRTQTAIRNFQQAKNLEVTGRLDEQTMEALGIEAAGQAETGKQSSQ